MNVSLFEARAIRTWCDADNLWVVLADGRQLSIPLSYFPRLLNATEAARRACIISGGGTGLHWEALDEDISVEGLLLGVGDRTRASDFG
jgi:hypothetical protein